MLALYVFVVKRVSSSQNYDEAPSEYEGVNR